MRRIGRGYFTACVFAYAAGYCRGALCNIIHEFQVFIVCYST